MWRRTGRAIVRRSTLAERALGGRLGFYRPEGGFFLWLKVGDGESAALRLWREAGIRVLPGGYSERRQRKREPGHPLHPGGAARRAASAGAGAAPAGRHPGSLSRGRAEKTHGSLKHRQRLGRGREQHPDAGPGQRLVGVALLALAAVLAAALIGYDSRDPSLNHASTAPVANPLGLLGASTADLLYQFFGIAAWLLPAAFGAWGLRLVARRSLPWPWLPVLALPLALLALAGFLGSLPKPTAWPIHTGLGGLVGFMLWDKIELLIGSVLYVVLALGLAGALCLVAMGARWHESAWVVGRVLAGSLWAGRHVGACRRLVRLGRGRTATAPAAATRARRQRPP